MDGGGDGEEELHLVDGALDVAVEAEAEDLEEHLEVVEGGEVDLEGPLVLEKESKSSLFWDLHQYHTHVQTV